MCSFFWKNEHMSNKNISRQISKLIQSTSKGVILLGPRQVGKSTLIESFKPDLTIHLADEMDFLRFSSLPGELAQLIQVHKPKTVYIDEIQRLPKMLNSIQVIMDKEKSKIKFYLTGSSARKLRRGGANLLPGRVLNFNLGPLVASELNYKMSTQKVLEYGSLPEIYLMENEKEKQSLLKSYTASYLKEEIKAEALTRNLESFARFLQDSVLHSAQFVDYTKFSQRAKISRHSCPRYFEILEDTLIGFRLHHFSELQDQLKMVKHPKFFFFDNGVYNGLLGNYRASADRMGVLSEQLVFSQIHHSAAAFDLNAEMYTFRLHSGEEVDFILKLDHQVFGIEVKTTDHLSSQDIEGLLFFQTVYPKVKGLYVFHMGTTEKKIGPVWCLPWQKGLKDLGL
jgi:predicted AAA+ superfamily ATPase